MKDTAFARNAAQAGWDLITICSAAGRLRARVLSPAGSALAPPLLVLHGISRNAGTLARLFAPHARQRGRALIVPHFNAADWPAFQRPSRAARPDQALLELLNRVAGMAPGLAGPVEIFGHSGGAQLAHRMAMLYPHRVGALHLAAAGWYCLPDRSMPFPYGLAEGEDPRDIPWARRKAAGLDAFLALPVDVYVGTADTTRDEALRQDPLLDAGQGPHRLARARRYVSAFGAAARVAGLCPRIRLIEMPGCVHDVVEAITRHDLAARVTGAHPFSPSL